MAVQVRRGDVQLVAAFVEALRIFGAEDSGDELLRQGMSFLLAEQDSETGAWGPIATGNEDKDDRQSNTAPGEDHQHASSNGCLHANYYATISAVLALTHLSPHRAFGPAIPGAATRVLLRWHNEAMEEARAAEVAAS